MMRRRVLEQHGLAYDEEFRHGEDFDFFMRAAEVTQLANIPEFLLSGRVHQQEVNVLYRRENMESARRLRIRQLRSLIPDASQEEENFHSHLTGGSPDASSLALATRWMLRLERANRESARYDVDAFQRELRREWHHFHHLARPPSLRVLVSYWNSPLASIREIRLRDHLRLIAKCSIGPILGWERACRWRRACRQFFERRRVQRPPQRG